MTTTSPAAQTMMNYYGSPTGPTGWINFCENRVDVWAAGRAARMGDTPKQRAELRDTLRECPDADDLADLMAWLENPAAR